MPLAIIVVHLEHRGLLLEDLYEGEKDLLEQRPVLVPQHGGVNVLEPVLDAGEHFNALGIAYRKLAFVAEIE